MHCSLRDVLLLNEACIALTYLVFSLTLHLPPFLQYEILPHPHSRVNRDVLYLHCNGNQELVAASEQDKAHVTDPNVAGGVHEEEEPGLQRCDDEDHQLRIQRPAQSHVPGGERCNGTYQQDEENQVRNLWELEVGENHVLWYWQWNSKPRASYSASWAGWN